MGKQIFRSKSNRVIAGVCGGMAEYFGIDPTLIRLIWVAICFTFGLGILAYVIAAIVIPEGSNANRYKSGDTNMDDSFNPGTNDWGKHAKADPDKNRFFIGIILVVLGGLFLTREFFDWFHFKYFWPIMFILVGSLIIFKGRRNSL